MKTTAEVFIIESLKFEDEQKSRFEGKILSDILALSRKHCLYFYIRTVRELRSVLQRFTASNYRYLHLLCHANHESLSTTLDTISFAEFANIICPHLKQRRLFVSACSIANDDLASVVMPRSGCYSILGPAQDIYFGDAAILWASLYHVMFAYDSNAMTGSILRTKAQAVANMYQLRLNYFGRDTSKKRGYIAKEITPDDDAC
jgi:hypothetical protein